MALADQIVVMNEGRIEDEGPPERLYARPRTRFTATFMGESTMIDRDGETIAIRPENMRIGADPGSQPVGEMRVKEIIFQGGHRASSASGSRAAPSSAMRRRKPLSAPAMACSCTRAPMT